MLINARRQARHVSPHLLGAHRSLARGQWVQAMEDEETNSATPRWRITGPLNPSLQQAYSDRIEQLLERAAELGKEANGARTDSERRASDALASMYEGTARSFAHLAAFRAMIDRPLI